MSRYYELNKIKKFNATINYDKVFKKYGKIATDKLKDNPGNLIKHRTKDEYSSTWKYKTVKNKAVTETIVYNRKNGPLTYLLENGHLIVNKHGGVGWAAPHPHISIVYDAIKNDFIRAIERSTIVETEIIS